MFVPATGMNFEGFFVFLLLAHSAPVTAVSFAPVPGITVDEGLRDVGEVIVAGDYKGHIKIYVNSEKL